jgi:YesN/AraC family two-component response regulator
LGGREVVADFSGGLEVVGEATAGRDAMRLTGKADPEVVVMVVAMPRLGALEARR